MQSPLEQNIKKSLDHSLHQLDSETLEKLNAARRHALNQPSQKPWFHFLRTPTFAGVAFCCVLGIAMLPALQSPRFIANAPMADMDQTAMLELLDDPDGLDTLSDPGFYLWVDEYVAQDGEAHAV